MQASPATAFRAALTRLGLSGTPAFHVVLGSGFGEALESGLAGWSPAGGFPFSAIPGLVAATVPDHRGEFRVLVHERSRQPVVFQLGRLHGYEGHAAREAVRPVLAARAAGIERFLLTNAAGGIDPAHRLGDVMLIRDHVNLTGQNPLVGPNPTGEDGAPLGPRFPDLSRAYEEEWSRGLGAELRAAGVGVHEGTYLGLLGPSFETPAEIAVFARWGVQAVGMSTVWETIALRHAGARVGGLSLIANAACGLGDGAPLTHEGVLAACRAAARKVVGAVAGWIGKELEKR